MKMKLYLIFILSIILNIVKGSNFLKNTNENISKDKTEKTKIKTEAELKAKREFEVKIINKFNNLAL